MVMHDQFISLTGTADQLKHVCTLEVGCPTCGRPATVRSQFVGTELGCAHCGGTFVVTEQIHGRHVTESTIQNAAPNEQSRWTAFGSFCGRTTGQNTRDGYGICGCNHQ